MMKSKRAIITTNPYVKTAAPQSCSNGLNDVVWSCLLNDYLPEEDERELQNFMPEPKGCALINMHARKMKAIEYPDDPRVAHIRAVGPSGTMNMDGTPGIWPENEPQQELPPLMWLQLDDNAPEPSVTSNLDTIESGWTSTVAKHQSRRRGRDDTSRTSSRTSSRSQRRVHDKKHAAQAYLRSKSLERGGSLLSAPRRSHKLSKEKEKKRSNLPRKDLLPPPRRNEHKKNSSRSVASGQTSREGIDSRKHLDTIPFVSSRRDTTQNRSYRVDPFDQDYWDARETASGSRSHRSGRRELMEDRSQVTWKTKSSLDFSDGYASESNIVRPMGFISPSTEKKSSRRRRSELPTNRHMY